MPCPTCGKVLATTLLRTKTPLQHGWHEGVERVVVSHGCEGKP